MPSQEQVRSEWRIEALFFIVCVLGMIILFKVEGLKGYENNDTINYAECPACEQCQHIPVGYDEYSDRNWTGIAVYQPVIIIPMTEDNKKQLEIECHEYAHILINDDYEHFCGQDEGLR